MTAHPSSPRRLLLVDDDSALRICLAELLNGRGYEVDTSPDGAAALQQLQQGRFDLVVTDLVMPGTRGDELLLQVRTRYPDLPVIVMSGSAPRATRDLLARDGATEFLLKPLRISPLLDAIARALDARDPVSSRGSGAAPLE